jgi:hypothetical protein
MHEGRTAKEMSLRFMVEGMPSSVNQFLSNAVFLTLSDMPMVGDMAITMVYHKFFDYCMVIDREMAYEYVASYLKTKELVMTNVLKRLFRCNDIISLVHAVIDHVEQERSR